MELDPLRNIARTVRRIPGYRKLRRSLVPSLRRNKVARTVAHRIFGTGRGRRGGADLTAGAVLDGIGTERLPVIVIVVNDCTDQRCRRVVDQVASAQLLGAAFKPYFLLDRPVFAPFRAYGYAVDLLIHEDAWTSTDQSWSTYVGRRLARLTDTFAVATIVRVTTDDLSAVDHELLISLGTKPVLPAVVRFGEQD